MIVERWKQHSYETLASNDDMEIMEEEVIYQGPEVKIEPSTEHEVWEIRTLKNKKSPGEDNISAELINHGGKKLWEEIHALIELIWT